MKGCTRELTMNVRHCSSATCPTTRYLGRIRSGNVTSREMTTPGFNRRRTDLRRSCGGNLLPIVATRIRYARIAKDSPGVGQGFGDRSELDDVVRPGRSPRCGVAFSREAIETESSVSLNRSVKALALRTRDYAHVRFAKGTHVPPPLDRQRSAGEIGPRRRNERPTATCSRLERIVYAAGHRPELHRVVRVARPQRAVARERFAVGEIQDLGDGMKRRAGKTLCDVEHPLQGMPGPERNDGDCRRGVSLAGPALSSPSPTMNKKRRAEVASWLRAAPASVGVDLRLADDRTLISARSWAASAAGVALSTGWALATRSGSCSRWASRPLPPPVRGWRPRSDGS